MWILTMVILFTQGGYSEGRPAAVSIGQEFSTELACNTAMQRNRESLTGGAVKLATCNPKYK